jgi:CHASE3 domain sensor protein
MSAMENLNQIIEERISKLTAEQQNLDIIHNSMVKQNQRMNQEFNQQVIKNQTRFAQITGAIEELSKLRNGASADNQPQEKPTP